MILISLEFHDSFKASFESVAFKIGVKVVLFIILRFLIEFIYIGMKMEGKIVSFLRLISSLSRSIDLIFFPFDGIYRNGK